MIDRAIYRLIGCLIDRMPYRALSSNDTLAGIAQKRSGSMQYAQHLEAILLETKIPCRTSKSRYKRSNAGDLPTPTLLVTASRARMQITAMVLAIATTCGLDLYCCRKRGGATQCNPVLSNCFGCPDQVTCGSFTPRAWQYLCANLQTCFFSCCAHRKSADLSGLDPRVNKARCQIVSQVAQPSH